MFKFKLLWVCRHFLFRLIHEMKLFLIIYSSVLHAKEKLSRVFNILTVHDALGKFNSWSTACYSVYYSPNVLAPLSTPPTMGITAWLDSAYSHTCLWCEPDNSCHLRMVTTNGTPGVVRTLFKVAIWPVLTYTQHHALRQNNILLPKVSHEGPWPNIWEWCLPGNYIPGIVHTVQFITHANL